jgi:hypothetical protein
MPRQLPWLNNGGGGLTQVKQPAKPRAATTLPSDSEDDFFDGTVLATSSKGKGKASWRDEDSAGELPDLSADPSTPRTKSRTKDATRKKRAPSSSPPPIADVVQPQTEYMRQGVSKFDLRDDEWMMVEDEFLETAKLFTRHLHIAEYEKLKERIEAKKKEQVQAVRPVVAGAKLSADGVVKKKAEVQAKRQHKAIRDVFALQKDEDEAEEQVVSLRRNDKSTPKQPPRPALSYETDSEDLDASIPPAKKSTSRPSAAKPTSTIASSSTTGPKSALPTAPTQKPASITPSFAKPALPAARPRGIARKSRFNVDMLDDYVPPVNRGSSNDESKMPPSTIPARNRMATPLSPTTPVRVLLPVKAAEKKPIDEGWGSGLSKETAERLAKRKAEREKGRDGKKKSMKLEDIPTFLV